MGKDTIGAELRRLVRERASGCCEYCLVGEQDTFFGCHIDLADDGCTIMPLSAFGRATERLLKLNAEERLLERLAGRETGG